MASLLSEKEKEQYSKLKEVAQKKLEIRQIKNEIRKINKEGTFGARISYFLASSTSKLMMTYIFVLCTIITVYSMIVMYMKDDLSSLPVLITAIIGETISYAIYSVKAYKGKKSEVDAQLERDKFEWEREEEGICNTVGEDLQFTEEDLNQDFETAEEGKEEPENDSIEDNSEFPVMEESETGENI